MFPRVCHCWEFPGGPVIGLHTSTVEGTGSIPGLWALQRSSSQRKKKKERKYITIYKELDSDIL